MRNIIKPLGLALIVGTSVSSQGSPKDSKIVSVGQPIFGLENHGPSPGIYISSPSRIRIIIPEQIPMRVVEDSYSSDESINREIDLELTPYQ